MSHFAGSHLPYLVAAYSAVWVVVGFYVFTLLRRNAKLNTQIDELESRIAELEK